jgi:CRISPR/Cas system-associated protein endoribonuclease Cas2
MVNPITALNITASGFGNQLSILFDLPQEKPENWKVYIFKRSGTDVTDAEIAEYFARISDPTYKFNKLWVFKDEDIFKSIPQKTKNKFESYLINDFEVLNGTVYYYRIVIYNPATEEYSEPVSGHESAQPEIKVDIIDSKELVSDAIKKFLDHVKNLKGEKAGLNKDVTVTKNFATIMNGGIKTGSWFLVERVNGAEYQRYWSDMQSQYSGLQNYVFTDTDVIRVTFHCQDNPDRRDTMADLFRAYKPAIRQRLLNIGEGKVKEVSINIEGDSIISFVEGSNIPVFVAVISLVIESSLTIGQEIITASSHITEDIHAE